jgi:hypothetical protein
MTIRFPHLTAGAPGQFRADNGVVFDFSRARLGSAADTGDFQLRLAQTVSEIYAAAARGGPTAAELVAGLARIVRPSGSHAVFTSIDEYRAAGGYNAANTPVGTSTEAYGSLGRPFLWINPLFPSSATGRTPGMGHLTWLIAHELSHNINKGHAEPGRQFDAAWMGWMRGLHADLVRGSGVIHPGTGLPGVRDPVTGRIDPHRSERDFTGLERTLQYASDRSYQLS